MSDEDYGQGKSREQEAHDSVQMLGTVLVLIAIAGVFVVFLLVKAG